MIKISDVLAFTPHSLSRVLAELELDQTVREAQNIVIKVNLAAGTSVVPESHVITHPEVLGNLIHCLTRVNPSATIHIAEGDSTGYSFAYLKFEHLDMPACLGLSERESGKVRLLDLSRDRLQRVENESFRYFRGEERQLWLSETLMNADFVMSIGNLKTHTVTGYTGACKNLFGSLPTSDKSVLHEHIHEIVHDLTLAIAPRLSIVDAFHAMEGNGPIHGRAVNRGYLIISDSAVEADIAGATSIGMDPARVRYLDYLASSLNINLAVTRAVVPLVVRFRQPHVFVRVMNAIGLWVQGFGHSVGRLGHRLHDASNPLEVVLAFSRPVLVRLVGIERLRTLKHKVSR